MASLSSEGRDDRDYWNDKYDEEPSCEVHGDDDMLFDVMEGDFYCGSCWIDDELKEIHKNG